LIYFVEFEDYFLLKFQALWDSIYGYVYLQVSLVAQSVYCLKFQVLTAASMKFRVDQHQLGYTALHPRRFYYGLDARAIEVRPRQRRKDFFSSLCVHTGSEAHPVSYTMGTAGPFPRG
jgi:hypothetical protein